MAKGKHKEKEEGKAKGKEKDSGPRARNDAYVMMLFITLLAIIAGSVLMHLDHEEYGGKSPPKEAAPTPAKLGDSDSKAIPATPSAPGTPAAP